MILKMVEEAFAVIIIIIDFLVDKFISLFERDYF